MSATPPRELFSFAQRARYWDALYERPSSLFEHHMRLRRDYTARYIARRFPLNSRLLDLGCGAGVLGEKLLSAGFQLTAADASSDMLSLAAARLGRFAPGAARLAQADCLALPFADCQFDLVISLGMFGYFEQASRALAEVRRVLRPGGTFILSVRNSHTHRAFDVLEWLKLPLRLGRSGLRRLRSRPPQSAPAVTGDDGFRIAIYQAPAPLIAGIEARGFELREFAGLGYGPWMLAQRKLFSEARAMRLSDGMSRLLHTCGLQRYSRWCADVSIYVFQRADDPSPPAGTSAGEPLRSAL